MRALLTILLALACCPPFGVFGLLGGCARTPDAAKDSQVHQAAQAKSAQDFPLSPEARLTYNYLLLEDMRRSEGSPEADEAAREILEQAGAPAAYMEVASYYSGRKRVDKAREVLKEAIARYPAIRQFHIVLASTYVAEKRYADAAVTLQEYLQVNPKDWKLREELAAVLLEGRKPSDALDALNAVPESERTAVMYLFMGQARALLGLKRPAAEAFETAAAKDREFAEPLAELAFLYESENDFLRAAHAYERLLAIADNKEEVRLRLIKLRLKLNEPEKAMRLARADAGRSFAFDLEAATTFIGEGFFEQARNLLAPHAKRGGPPDIWFPLAVIAYEGDKNSAQALELLEKIPPDHPHSERSQSFRAHLLYYAGRKAEALELVGAARREGKAGREMVILESVIHEDENRFEDGLTILREAEAKWPDDPDILYQRGAILERMDRRAEARQVMERVLALKPDHAEALNYVGYLLADTGEDPARALAMIKLALEKKPGSGFIIDSLAWAYFKLGQFQNAWREINKAVALMPNDPEAWEHYAEIASAMGRKADARRGFQRAIDLGADNRTELEARLNAL